MKTNCIQTVLVLIEENNQLLDKIKELEKVIFELKTTQIYYENKLCY